MDGGGRDGEMDEWIDGQMVVDRWIGGWVDGWMDGWMDGWITNEWMDE